MRPRLNRPSSTLVSATTHGIVQQGRYVANVPTGHRHYRWRASGRGYNLYSLCRSHQCIVSKPQTWMCLICGWVYDEAAGDPEHGIAPGTAWADVPMNWTCPECGARREDFEMVQV